MKNWDVRLWFKKGTQRAIQECTLCISACIIVSAENVQFHHQLLHCAAVLQLLWHYCHSNLLSSQPRRGNLGKTRAYICVFCLLVWRRGCTDGCCVFCQSSCRVSRNTLSGYFLAGRDMAWWPVSNSSPALCSSLDKTRNHIGSLNLSLALSVSLY